MVLVVCRQVLGRYQDAEDAFQATFLALAHKAGTIRNRQLLWCWLREVAYRNAYPIAQRSHTTQKRNPDFGCERLAPWARQRGDRNEVGSSFAPVDGLPANYRSLVLQSYIEGKSNEQVARLLRCPLGTVKGQLSRARSLLRAHGWASVTGTRTNSNRDDDAAHERIPDEEPFSNNRFCGAGP